MSFDEYASCLAPPRPRNVGAALKEGSRDGWDFLKVYERRAMREVRKRRKTAAMPFPDGSVQRPDPPTS